MAGIADWAETADTGNLWLDKLNGDTRWDSAGTTTVIAVYTAGMGGAPEALDYDVAWPITANVPLSEELEAFALAMRLYEQVCNVEFRAVTDLSDTDIIWASIGNEGADFDGDGPEEPALGWADPPGSILNEALATSRAPSPSTATSTARARARSTGSRGGASTSSPSSTSSAMPWASPIPTTTGEATARSRASATTRTWGTSP